MHHKIRKRARSKQLYLSSVTRKHGREKIPTIQFTLTNTRKHRANRSQTKAQIVAVNRTNPSNRSASDRKHINKYINNKLVVWPEARQPTQEFRGKKACVKQLTGCGRRVLYHIHTTAKQTATAAMLRQQAIRFNGMYRIVTDGNYQSLATYDVNGTQARERERNKTKSEIKMSLVSIGHWSESPAIRCDLIIC